jgi:hypothetical protein
MLQPRLQVRQDGSFAIHANDCITWPNTRT